MSAGAIFLFWWQIWKERNGCIFEQQESSSLQVAEKIKAAAREYNLALMEC
jgi:hypothetical protein